VLEVKYDYIKDKKRDDDKFKIDLIGKYNKYKKVLQVLHIIYFIKLHEGINDM